MLVALTVAFVFTLGAFALTRAGRHANQATVILAAAATGPPMRAQHGETFDPSREPEPRGGWFRLVDRPFPEKLDRTFRVLAAIAGAAAPVATVGLVLAYGTRPASDVYGWLALGAAIAAAMAYGFVRALGLILVAAYGTLRDGSEFVVDWAAVRHDAGLRRTWIVILEGTLLLAAAGISLWGLLLFARHGLVYGLAVCVVVQLMTYWPLIRRRIAAGRTHG